MVATVAHHVGDAVVVRVRQHKGKPASRIAKVVKTGPLRVRLWMCNFGGVKWSMTAREVGSVEILRAASPREVALGIVI